MTRAVTESTGVSLISANQPSIASAPTRVTPLDCNSRRRSRSLSFGQLPMYQRAPQTRDGQCAAGSLARTAIEVQGHARGRQGPRGRLR